MARKYTFSIGLEDKDAKKQLISTPMAAIEVEKIFVRHGVDCTISSGYRGVYHYEDGSLAREETIVVVAYSFEGAKIPVAELCADIKTTLNQESVAVENVYVKSRLY